MKKILQEILNRKEYSYSIGGYDKSLNGTTYKVVTFHIFNIKNVKYAYDKYTFLSKKDYFYVVELEQLAMVELFPEHSIIKEHCVVNVYNDKYYDHFLKLAKNLNEYSETRIVLSGDRVRQVDDVILKKETVDAALLLQNQYIQNETVIYLKDVLKMVDVSKIEKINYYND